jgi:hypothetical protein
VSAKKCGRISTWWSKYRWLERERAWIPPDAGSVPYSGAPGCTWKSSVVRRNDCFLHLATPVDAVLEVAMFSPAEKDRNGADLLVDVGVGWAEYQQVVQYWQRVARPIQTG